MATTVAAPLPDLELEEQSVLTVRTNDATAIITRIVIHFAQDVPDLPETFPPWPVLLAHDPDGGALPPGPVLT